jgi:hypothetical protein
VAEIKAIEATPELETLISLEMELAGWKAWRQFDPESSDFSEQMRAVLLAMLASSDRRFRQALIEIWK